MVMERENKRPRVEIVIDLIDLTHPLSPPQPPIQAENDNGDDR